MSEKTCTRCNESWPADGEFFRPMSLPSRLASWCRACEAEQKALSRRVPAEVRYVQQQARGSRAVKRSAA